MPQTKRSAQSITHYVVDDGTAPAPRRKGLWPVAIACAVAVGGAAAGWTLTTSDTAPAGPHKEVAAATSPDLFSGDMFALRLDAKPAVADVEESARRVVAGRMAHLRLRQDDLMARQAKLDELLRDAKARDIPVDPTAPEEPSRKPLLLARLDQAPVGAPKPVLGEGQAIGFTALNRAPAIRRAEELDLALRTLERTQNAIFSALEDAMESRVEVLAEVPARLGLQGPEKDTGGPLVELRGADSLPAPADRFEAVRASLKQIDELERMVDALPVRLPIERSVRISSTFGRRVDPFLGRPAMHTGLDLAVPRGTPVHAAGAGKVTFAGWNGGYGRMIEIDHGNGHSTRYGHLSRIDVAKGERIDPGEVIGAVGSSGRSTGPHLHYEMVRDGRRRDPAPYLTVAREFDGRI